MSSLIDYTFFSFNSLKKKVFAIDIHIYYLTFIITNNIYIKIIIIFEVFLL